MENCKIYEAFKKQMEQALSGGLPMEDGIMLRAGMDKIAILTKNKELLCEVSQEEFDKEILAIAHEESMIRTWKAVLLKFVREAKNASDEMFTTSPN